MNRILLIFNTLISLVPLQINSAKAFEFQWDPNDGYKRLRWRQRTAEKNFKNKIFFFFMPRDRKTGLLSINIKIPKNFKSTLKTKNITFCKANFGGYTSKTKCIEDIPSDIVFDDKNKRLEICPICRDSNLIFYVKKYEFKMDKCQSCGLIFCNPYPSKKQIYHYYNSEMKKFENIS